MRNRWLGIINYVCLQQTPKPEAQLPSEMPFVLPHSSALRQIPLKALADWATHSSLGN